MHTTLTAALLLYFAPALQILVLLQVDRWSDTHKERSHVHMNPVNFHLAGCSGSFRLKGIQIEIL